MLFCGFYTQKKRNRNEKEKYKRQQYTSLLQPAPPKAFMAAEGRGGVGGGGGRRAGANINGVIYLNGMAYRRYRLSHGDYTPTGLPAFPHTTPLRAYCPPPSPPGYPL